MKFMKNINHVAVIELLTSITFDASIHIFMKLEILFS